MSINARSEGVSKTHASKKACTGHLASDCVSGLTDECLQDIAIYRDHFFCAATAGDCDEAWLETSIDPKDITGDRNSIRFLKMIILTRTKERRNEEVENLFLGNSGPSVINNKASSYPKVLQFPENNGPSNPDQCKASQI